MKSILIAAAIAVTLSGVSASAQEAAEPPKEKKICRSERMTGSLTRSTRICLTAAQWKEVNDRTRKGVDEMASAASGGKQCGSNAQGSC
jgi:hypothetical protein